MGVSLQEKEQLFLVQDKGENARFKAGSRQPCHTFNVYNTIIFITFATITTISLAVNVWLLLHVRESTEHVPTTFDTNGLKIPYSPADAYVTYRIKPIHTHNDQDRFIGPPGEDFDRAWSELLRPGTIRVTADELRKAGKQSLRLRGYEDENYAAYLESYHQLHCVKRMVQFRWPERYHTLREQHMLTDDHFNHCIQVMRKGFMCNGDTSLNTYTWEPKNLTHMMSISNSPRKCVNWERLHEWAVTRAIGRDYKVLGAHEEGHLGPK